MVNLFLGYVVQTDQLNDQKICMNCLTKKADAICKCSVNADMVTARKRNHESNYNPTQTFPRYTQVHASAHK